MIQFEKPRHSKSQSGDAEATLGDIFAYSYIFLECARLGVRQESWQRIEGGSPHGEGLANRPDPE
jgi:hypothetical protein